MNRSSKFRKAAAGFTLAVFGAILSISALPMETQAEEELLPAAESNVSVGRKKTSFMAATDEGYVRVYVKGQELRVEELNDAFEVLSKKTIALPLSVWGSFYSSSDAYYVAVAKGTAEKDADPDGYAELEDIRVIKYDKSWTQVGEVKFSSGDYYISNAFTTGSVEMSEKDGKLLVAATVNQGNSFAFLEIDEQEFTGTILNSVYSMNKALDAEYVGDRPVCLAQDNGKYVSRLFLTEYDELPEASVPIMEYEDESQSYYKYYYYSSVDDLAVSDSHILTLGTSVDQSRRGELTVYSPHNVYLSATPIDDLTTDATEIRWLTDYVEDGETYGKLFTGANMTKISDDRFLIMWQEFDTDSSSAGKPDSPGRVLYYLFVDGSGNAVSEVYTARGWISDCHPIVNGDKVVFYASTPTSVEFYQIDAADGSFTQVDHRVIGETITWDIQDGVLIISGTGEMTVDREFDHRPISNGRIYFQNTIPVWAELGDEVKGIRLEEGITAVSKECFMDVGRVERVDLPASMEEIGDRAFGYNYYLRNVYFPGMKVNIGADAFWCGYYYYDDTKSHHETLICQEGSDADKYGEENNISRKYYLLDENGDRVIGIVFRNGAWECYDEEGLRMNMDYLYGQEKIGDKTYYFNDDHEPVFGWVLDYGNWYYYLESGTFQTGWLKNAGKSYYFNDEGLMQTGWQLIGGKWYYLSSGGIMQTGWLAVVNKKFYLAADGVMQTGWITLDGKTYYFNADGVMQTGTVTVEGEKCIFSYNGMLITKGAETVQKGWKLVNTDWLYYENGQRVTGWKTIGNKKYWFALDGIMQTGWRYLGKAWYYFGDNGMMRTGWQAIDGKWYYFNAEGAMLKRWQKLGGKWYYFDPSGYMVTGERTINGKLYRFNASGACLNP